MSSAFSDLYSRAFGAADITVTAAGGSGMFDDSVVKKVRGYEGVESAARASRFLHHSSWIRNCRTGCRRSGSRLLGVEPESASLATGFELTQGSFPGAGGRDPLRRWLRREHRAKVGDKVTLGNATGA